MPSHNLIHSAQYSADDHHTFQQEVSFWRHDGYHVEIHYRGPVWLLLVYDTPTKHSLPPLGC
jgi:hypothetical protein